MSFQFAINLLNELGSATCATLRHSFQQQLALRICILLVFTVGVSSSAKSDLNAKTNVGVAANQQEIAKTSQTTEQPDVPPNLESTEDWNRRLRERFASTDPMPSFDPREYVIGPEDVLDINVFEAPEMNRDVRVSASGEISLPLLGAVAAGGFTPRELETALEKLLHQKYMKDPHVSVFVRDMQSHPVSVAACGSEKRARVLFCESERVGGIFASDAVARVWRAQRNGHWFRQGGRKFQGGGPGKFEGPPRFDRSAPQPSGISGRHRQSFPSGNRVCGGFGAKAGRFRNENE